MVLLLKRGRRVLFCEWRAVFSIPGEESFFTFQNVYLHNIHMFVTLFLKIFSISKYMSLFQKPSNKQLAKDKIIWQKKTKKQFAERFAKLNLLWVLAY